MERKSIGTLIAALRRANGLTQKQLADQLGVSDKAVSRWERDESLPDLTLLPVIADLFHITVDELLRGERRAQADGAYHVEWHLNLTRADGDVVVTLENADIAEVYARSGDKQRANAAHSVAGSSVVTLQTGDTLILRNRSGAPVTLAAANGNGEAYAASLTVTRL